MKVVAQFNSRAICFSFKFDYIQMQVLYGLSRLATITVDCSYSTDCAVLCTATGSLTSDFTLSRILSKKRSKPTLDTMVTNPVTDEGATNVEQVVRQRSGSKTSQDSNHSLTTGL